MELEEILSRVRSGNLKETVEEFLFRDSVPAISSSVDYENYKSFILQDHPRATDVLIGGSGNWGYSFSPKKLFRPFGSHSDIDLVIVSQTDFVETWEALRAFHRTNWNRIGSTRQLALRRNGENVYSGFVTPKWIDDLTQAFRISYEEKANAYSSSHVGFLPVNIMYFKNKIELIDYYLRSFTHVRRKANAI